VSFWKIPVPPEKTGATEKKGIHFSITITHSSASIMVPHWPGAVVIVGMIL
jgi:hypothetical protein